MKRSLIIALVTIFHLLLIAMLMRSCTGHQKETDASDSKPPGGDGSQTETQHTPPEDGAGSPTVSGTPVRSLQRIPFTYVSAKLSPALEARQKACRTGILVNWDSKQILWRKSPDLPVPIASMTKMMTTLLLMERIKSDPAVSLQTPVPVSKAASLVGGSQVYLDPRESLSLDELLKCTIIFSANDAAYQVAEFLGGGSVDSFVTKMNARAKQLGLNKAYFHSPHGLTDDATGQTDKATATELAFLGALLLDYPEVVKWSSTRLSYIRENNPKFKPFQLVNRNSLIREPGINGMKTGYTKEAGFCVTATCKREGRTLIAVVTGCSTKTDRNELVKELFKWGYEQ